MVERDVRLAFEPRAHQRAAHAFRLAIRFLVLVWHRRSGKTVFAILELVLAALACSLPRGRYAYIAPLLKQAKSVAWDYLKAYTEAIPGVRYNEAELTAELPNGATIRLFGADQPDSLRGLYFDGIVLDEVAQMKPNVWGEIIRPALADRGGWAIFIGTPKGVNLFSELYYLALRGKDGWKADLRRASETGVLSEAELAHAKATMTEQQYAQEFDCDFEATTENQLIGLSHVLLAQDRKARELDYNFAPRLLGVDVARYGDDESVLFRRQGIVAFRPQRHSGLDTQELAAHVAHDIARWKPHATFVDVGGIGGGVVDRLLHLGFNVIPVDAGSKPLDPKYENKRAEMWDEMADWVKTVGCLPPDVDRLATDLTAPTYTYANKRGRMQLESKDAMRARGLSSPDVGDALAMTFAFPVAAPIDLSTPGGPYLHSQAPGTTPDWDPFEERA